LGDQALEYTAAILDSTARLGNLIDNVLDLTQGDAGGLPIERKRVELMPLLQEALGGASEEARDKSIDLVHDIDASVGVVKGDARRLRQAIDQLLHNAITYTPVGGRVLLHAEGTTEQALIVVSDNGPGMDEAEQARALDRFSRVGAGRARDADGGLGIGLPLAHQFVESHGGTMRLVSELGQGTAVQIELPRA